MSIESYLGAYVEKGMVFHSVSDTLHHITYISICVYLCINYIYLLLLLANTSRDHTFLEPDYP